MGATLLVLLIATPAAYYVARFRFPGRLVFLLLVLITQMLQPTVLAVGLFQQFKGWQGYAVWAALILINAAFNLSFAIWIMQAFFAGVPKEIDEAALIDAPKTQLNAQLNGVLASSDPAKAIAIIAHNGLQNSYGIGDYIDGTQARIRQVFADRVIITRDGRDETLMLDGEEYGKPLPKVTRQGAELSSVRSELMSNPGKITDYLNISPVRVDGRMVGYRLNPGSNPEVFNQLGLVANDLAVSINGLDLRDNAQAMQAMQQVAGATEMTVTVERQGQLYDVYVGLSE